MSVRNEDGFTPMKSLIQKAPEAALVNISSFISLPFVSSTYAYIESEFDLVT